MLKTSTQEQGLRHAQRKLCALSAQSISVMLHLLERRGEEHYTYKRSADLGIKTGTLYPILECFEEYGWTHGEWEQLETSEQRRPARRYITLTQQSLDEGLALLETTLGKSKLVTLNLKELRHE